MEITAEKFQEFEGGVAALIEYRKKAEEDLKAFGDVTTETKAAIDKINEHLSNLEFGPEQKKAIEDRVAAVETRLNTPETTAGDDEDKVDRYAEVERKFMREGRSALTADEVKVLTTDNDTGAGYLCSDERISEIIKGVAEFSPLRQYATVRTTSKKSVDVPKRTAQFSAAYVEQGDSMTESTGLAYGLETIPTHKIYALVKVSIENLDDADYNLESEINMEAAERFGVFEGTEFVTGAAGRVEGILGNADVGNTVSGNASTIASGDCLWNLFYAVKDVYASNGYWTAKRATLGTIRTLKDGTGNYLWAPGFQDQGPTICGRPYFESVDMPAIAANAYPVAFGDYRRAYLVVDRTQIVMQRLVEKYSEEDVIGFKFTKRIGGQVVLAEAIRKLKIAAS